MVQGGQTSIVDAVIVVSSCSSATLLCVPAASVLVIVMVSVVIRGTTSLTVTVEITVTTLLQASGYCNTSVEVQILEDKGQMYRDRVCDACAQRQAGCDCI